MEKKVYYRVQFSEDGERWETFRTDREDYVCISLDEAREVYDRMIEWHKKPFNHMCKYHRIVKLTVEIEEVAVC